MLLSVFASWFPKIVVDITTLYKKREKCRGGCWIWVSKFAYVLLNYNHIKTVKYNQSGKNQSCLLIRDLKLAYSKHRRLAVSGLTYSALAWDFKLWPRQSCPRTLIVNALVFISQTESRYSLREIHLLKWKTSKEQIAWASVKLSSRIRLPNHMYNCGSLWLCFICFEHIS